MRTAVYIRVSTEDQAKKVPRRFLPIDLQNKLIHRDKPKSKRGGRYFLEVQREYLEAYAERE